MSADKPRSLKASERESKEAVKVYREVNPQRIAGYGTVFSASLSTVTSFKKTGIHYSQRRPQRDAYKRRPAMSPTHDYVTRALQQLQYFSIAVQDGI